MAVKKDSKVKPAVAALGEKAPAMTLEAKTAAAATGVEINIDDLGRLVANMSRLLAGFGQLKPLREAGLGLGEWVALGMLARQEGMTNKLMSRNLGVPVQRVAQISYSLVQSGLLSVGQAAEGGKAGKAGKVLKITDAGRAKLEAVNSEMKVALSPVLKARALGGALKQMKPLGRVLRVATVGGVNKRKARSAKQAEGASRAQAAPVQA